MLRVLDWNLDYLIEFISYWFKVLILVIMIIKCMYGCDFLFVFMYFYVYVYIIIIFLLVVLYSFGNYCCN